MAFNQLAKILSVSALGLLGLIACNRTLPHVASTDSPDKTYQANLKGNPKHPTFFLSPENEMRLDVFKGGKLYISNVLLDSYDSMDADWEILHPDHTWVNDSLLRFGWEKDFSDLDPSYVSVTNETDKVLKYVMVEARDILFLLDVPPRTCKVLKSAHQGNLSWVTAQGQFADGTPLRGSYSNFYDQDKAAKPLQYCVTVKEQSIQVASLTLVNEQGTTQPRCFCEHITSKQSSSPDNTL